ncbi:cytochrome P450 [Haloactinopolyspora alba]|nr:cytochrome P450 [Haloactinopolyspora alba]
MLLMQGYRFVPRRWRRSGSDVFELRLLGERVICVHGPDAARLFYDPQRFERAGAAPRRLQKTLLGAGGVHGLDDAAHRARKRMFMDLMTQRRIDELVALTRREWLDALPSWSRRDRVVLFDEARVVLCRAICAWAGVPLPERDVRRRADDLTAMVDAFGAAGPRHWRGKAARRRCEAWIEAVVDDVRSGRLDVSEEQALDRIARFRDVGGQPLDRRVAAVEVLNVLRPTMAVAYFVVFMAIALHEQPDRARRLRAGDDEDVERFVQEVRRYFPFTPFLGARVRSGFDWQGHRFDEGTLVLLDVYGAHHDGRVFGSPGVFDPDRGPAAGDSGFELIPQGGGGFRDGHRCAGEWITIALMKTVCRLLTGAMTYEVPAQDLAPDLRRIPPKPRSGFAISHVRASASTLD